MNIKTYILLVLLLLSRPFISSGFAQTKDLAYMKIQGILASHLATRGSEILALEKYKNKAYFFSVSLYVNNEGMVDSLQYTNVSDELDSLISIPFMSKQFKSEKRAFRQHKDSILICLVYIRRGWDEKIDNIGYLDKTFSTIFPSLTNLPENIRVKVLPAFSMVQAKPTLH